LTVEKAPLASGELASDANRSRSGGLVLVVDDSRLVRIMISGYLRGGGFHVDEAGGGAEAIDKLSSGNYDVVVTDLQMPGVDGFAVLAAAKDLGQGVEVIVLTGAHSEDMGSAVRALRMGAHDYMTKPPPSAEEVVLTVDRAMEKRQLREANRQLLRQFETLSLTDALTGVPNRRAFDRTLEQEIARSRRHGQPLGVIALDIDHFKRVNDTYGHDGGDTILRAFAKIVLSVLRKEDSLYRCGGEEFSVVLPLADRAGLVVVAERLVAVVGSSPVQVGSVPVVITTSAGAACLEAKEDGTKFLSRADAALYEAKRGGRNRVCLHEGALPEIRSLP
jgi:two-component system cell cycle response regulator